MSELGVDHEVFYMKPVAKGVNKDISMEPSVITVRGENLTTEFKGFTVLKAENGGDLVRVLIPNHLVLGINTFKRGDTPGYA